MDRQSLMFSVDSYKDVKKITKVSPKYINLTISNPDIKIIDYFMKNGNNFLYADLIDNKKGYIYVDYSIFYRAQLIINNLVFNIDSDFNELEKARYIYIKLGKMLGLDINSMPNKNDTFNFNNLNTINNIWGSLYNYKATNVSIVKLYLYVCSLLGIKCEIINTSDKGYLCNKLTINEKEYFVDLTKDLPYIQANFKTKYFDNYNEDMELDKKIGYIKKKYNDILIDEELKNIDYTSELLLENILLKTQNIIKVENIKSNELSLIYKEIFDKYCPNYHITINNLYYNNETKDHFILFSYNDKHYCYNYNKLTFIPISIDSINNSINDNVIGIYLEEEMLETKNKAYV